VRSLAVGRTYGPLRWRTGLAAAGAGRDVRSLRRRDHGPSALQATARTGMTT